MDIMSWLDTLNENGHDIIMVTVVAVVIFAIPAIFYLHDRWLDHKWHEKYMMLRNCPRCGLGLSEISGEVNVRYNTFDGSKSSSIIRYKLCPKDDGTSNKTHFKRYRDDRNMDQWS